MTLAIQFAVIYSSSGRICMSCAWASPKLARELITCKIVTSKSVWFGIANRPYDKFTPRLYQDFNHVATNLRFVNLLTLQIWLTGMITIN